MRIKKCQKCGNKINELVTINVGKNIFLYWCKNCVFVEMEKRIGRI